MSINPLAIGAAVGVAGAVAYYFRNHLRIAARLSVVVGTTITGKKMCERVLEYVLANSTRNDVDSVIDAIDDYATNKGFLINVGPEKGQILDSYVSRPNVVRVLELGCFMGYGALRILRTLKNKSPGVDFHLTSIDPSALWGAVATRHVHHAGLAAHFDLRTGLAQDVLPQLAKEGLVFDLVFVDHDKDAYTDDVDALLKLGLLKRPGGIIVADNILFPGNPKYEKYILARKDFKTTAHETHVEYSKLADRVLGSIALS